MKKGFTLVEMIATLVILSIIAVIVTPNIYVSIKDYKNRLFETQMDNIKQSAKNWAVDNVDKLPTSESNSLAVTISDLQDGGYIDDNLENPRDGGVFDDSSVFTLITCEYVEDETGNLASNYKYKYEIYENVEDYVKKQAASYAKKNKITSNTTISVSDLKNQNYISKKVLYINGTELVVSNDSVNIVVTTSEDSKTGDTIYEYSAEIG